MFGEGGSGQLPPYTFTYYDKLHLTLADNGYGGQVSYTYELTTELAGAARKSYTEDRKRTDTNFCQGWVLESGSGSVTCQAGGPAEY